MRVGKRTVRIRRKPSVAVLLSCVLLAGLASYKVRMDRRYKHFAVHEPGMVYRSAWLAPDVFAELIAKYHIRTVVNLCDCSEKCDGRIERQREAVEAAGAQLVELMFPPNSTWDLDYPEVHQFERLIEDPNSFPMWIHCWHGRERTVKALAIYDIKKRGMRAEQSLQRMPLYGMDHPWPIIAFAYDYETYYNRLATSKEAVATTRQAQQTETDAVLRR